MTPIDRGPWAIRPEDFRAALESYHVALEAARGGTFARPPEPQARREQTVAVVPVQGVLTRRPSLFSAITGSGAYPWLTQAVRSLAEDPDVAAIVLDVDSPGGDALGLAEVSDAVYDARQRKPVVAVVRGMGASAAYFIASAASRVVVAKDSMVGALGSVMTVVDFRRADEAAGIDTYEIVSSQTPRKRPDPATDEGRAQLQAEVDAMADVFIQGVARNRGVSAERVLTGYGRGALFVGADAVRAGLADAVGTLGEELRRLGAGPEAPPEPSPAPAPAPDEADAWWEDVERDADRAARLDRLRDGPGPSLGGPELPTAGRQYVARLRAAGVSPTDAGRLVRGDEEHAQRLGLRTLGATLAADREAREGYLADAEAEEAHNAKAAPGATRIDDGTPSERRTRGVLSVARRMGLVREDGA